MRYTKKLVLKLVISHTAPSEAAREILKGLNGSFFLSKQIDLESRTSLALQEMFKSHQPSAWYFGHFHINREFLIGETMFRCLAEMAEFEVVSLAHPAAIIGVDWRKSAVKNSK